MSLTHVHTNVHYRYWDNNDGMWLARVPEATPTNVSAFEFFTGLEPTSKVPQWTHDGRQGQVGCWVFLYSAV